MPDDGTGRFASLAERVRADPAAFPSTRALVEVTGSSRPAISALILEHAHLTPDAWLRRARIDAAEDRLLDSGLTVNAIAEAARFSSEGAFRREFLRLAGMTPEAFRALGTGTAFELRLPAGYRAEDVLAYHGRDPASPSERVTGRRLAKAVPTADGPLVLEIEVGRRRASCRVHASRRTSPRGMRDAHRAARRMLGLTFDVRGFEAYARREPALAPLVARRAGLHLPLTATVFDALCWAILGQQINLAFACALRRDVLDLAGERIDGLIAHPAPERIAALDIATLKRKRFSTAKAEYLRDTAAAVAAGVLDPESLGDGSAIAAERAMTRLRGIGIWTARYVLMRGAGFADSAPVGDVALAAALAKVTGADARPTPSEVDSTMRRFSPYRSLATFHLWASLRDER